MLAADPVVSERKPTDEELFVSLFYKEYDNPEECAKDSEIYQKLLFCETLDTRKLVEIHPLCDDFVDCPMCNMIHCKERCVLHFSCAAKCECSISGMWPLLSEPVWPPCISYDSLRTEEV